MSTSEKKPDPEQRIPDFVVAVERVAEAYNVMRLFWFEVKGPDEYSDPVIICDLPHLPPEHPTKFMEKMTLAQSVAAHTLRSTHETKKRQVLVAIDGEESHKVANAMFQDVIKKIQTAVVGADGNPILVRDENGWMWREDMMPPAVRQQMELAKKKAIEQSKEASKPKLILDDDDNEEPPGDHRLELLN